MYIVLTIEMEEREDRWAAWSPEFGYTAYGHTEIEAYQQFFNGFHALIDSFDDVDKLREYISNRCFEDDN